MTQSTKPIDQFTLGVDQQDVDGNRVSFRADVEVRDTDITMIADFPDVLFTYQNIEYSITFFNKVAQDIRPISTEISYWEAIYISSEIDGSLGHKLTPLGKVVLQKCQEMVDDILRRPHVQLLRHTHHLQSVIARYEARRDTILSFLLRSSSISLGDV